MEKMTEYPPFLEIPFYCTIVLNLEESILNKA